MGEQRTTFTKGGPSLSAIRLRAPHTADDAQWAKTFKTLRDNSGACDEVWFCTGVGFPKMTWHAAHSARLARYANELRAAGIVPSLQILATLGHSDATVAIEGADGKNWGGFTGRGGQECLRCGCPRQSGLLAYCREMARLYAAAFRPWCVWIDDDLRIAGHNPGSPWKNVEDGWIGCWCPTCIRAFNAETEGRWTRESLSEAIQTDEALYRRWEKFSFDSLAGIARAIAEAVHAVSPETRMGLQLCPCGDMKLNLAVFEALHEATGLPVCSRPGGGAYFDQNPNAPLVKAFALARQRSDLGDPEWIDTWCPEIETFPRGFASRTAQGLLVEAFANLALGMNCLSLFIMDTRAETDEWYGENLLAPLAAERPFFDAYLQYCAGTVPAGFADATSAAPEALYRFALAGIPVLPGPGRACGSVGDADLSFNIEGMSSSSLLDLRRRLDERTGGRTPVVAETPSVGLIVPRVAPDGALRTVALVNARIDEQKPMTLRLRDVPMGTKSAVWHEMRCKPVTLALMRDGHDALVTVSAIAPWNCGWLGLCHDGA